MKKIHVLMHVPYETPGCIENWVREKSCSYSVTRHFAGELLPEVPDFDWLIVMGGPMSVNDTEEFPWLADEKRLISGAVKSGKVVIGICLGSQLIAEVLGSTVYRNRVREIGWFPVTKEDAAETSLFKEFGESETVFHWHGDTFDLPQGAERIFHSAGCKNQCFVYGDRIVGLQFHVEVTEELLDKMIEHGAEEIRQEAEYIQSAEEIRSGAGHIARNNRLMYSILDRLDCIL